MTIPKTAKCLEENRRFLVLKTGGHKYCVFSKKDDQVVFEGTSANSCFEYLEHKNVKHGSN